MVAAMLRVLLLVLLPAFSSPFSLSPTPTNFQDLSVSLPSGLCRPCLTQQAYLNRNSGFLNRPLQGSVPVWRSRQSTQQCTMALSSAQKEQAQQLVTELLQVCDSDELKTQNSPDAEAKALELASKLEVASYVFAVL